ncbi:uncharacterized protein APUU_40487S [Aspergillus puulaauensis]|uniref:Uncharacterized protein n=1 Tax=Aspergillus puulaauensis TaxID=1220207 RepID=A0A7R7XN69_9EURO|nr:uncharacterized protein APUU_40487S [Aspergillus puulaauensis]BCS24043.1 hypothetical protein APUU_40487S [Aspergillus puulaauensis]
MANPPQDKGTSHEATPIPPFDALSKYVSPPTNDQEQWWHHTGSLLGRMLQSAQYPLDQQYQYLKFFEGQVSPRLGPYPSRFRSNVTVSGDPVELSVNYQQRGGTRPIVRIGFEAMDSYSGSKIDPFNQLPASDVIRGLSRLELKGFDPHLFAYFGFRHTLTKEETDRLADPELAGRTLLRSQYGFGLDLKNGSVVVKGYTFPGLKTVASGQSISELVTDSISQLSQPKASCADAWETVKGYMAETSSFNQFHVWSWDYVDPSLSRLKFYSVSNEFTWRKVEEVWTVNKLLAADPVNIEGLKYLRQLWDIIQPSDSERKVIEDRPAYIREHETPLLWNYEMTPGSPIPYAKPYFSMHGINDLACVENLARFFEVAGLKDLAASYPGIVKAYFPEHDLAKTSHLVMWVSYAYSEKTGIYLSVYYHSSGDVPVSSRA